MLNPFHNPPHLYLDETVYFITASALNKKPYFDTYKKKQILRNKLFGVIKKLNFSLYAWVILSNHYHILLKTNKGKDLSKFIQLLHGGSSFELNKLDKIKERQVWFNYWDKCIRDDRDFENHCDYTHFNPVKHEIVKKPEDYLFSSYKDFIRRGYYEIGWGYIEPGNIVKFKYDN